MRGFLIAIVVSLAFVGAAKAEDAGELRAQGIQALNESQTTPSRIVEAARIFVKAEALYAQTGDEEKAVEMNSFLYWCKKKMTLEDINRFTNGGDSAVAVKLKAVEELAPKAEDAQVWFERAEKFARRNPDAHFLVAVRYFEVASRFVGSEISIKAQELSLNEQAMANNQRPAAPAGNVPAKTIVDPATLRAVPAAEKLNASETLIKDLLKTDYANVDAAGRIALYGKLLQQADENKGDSAAEYVLLREARDTAVLSGDGARAIHAQGRLKGAFKIEAVALNAELQRLTKSARSADAAQAMAMLLASIGNDALASENYEQAVRAYSQAEDLLVLVKDAAFKTKLKNDSTHVQTLRRESVAAASAMKTLAEKPNDPEANLTAGKFALECGHFEQAFALLAKGKDAVLCGLAKSELAPSTDAAEQVKIGDGWFDRAEKEFNAVLKTRMQERAVVWYGKALPGLMGLAKLKINERLKGLSGFEKSETDGQTAANSNRTGPHSANIWISKDAHYTVSSKYAEAQKVWENQPSFLNGEKPFYASADDGFSFATKTENSPYALIDLGTKYNISGFEIVNRIWREKQKRAESLTVWISIEANGPWQEVWRAEKAEAKWEVVLPNSFAARYVKVGLRATTEFDLASMKIFGERGLSANKGSTPAQSTSIVDLMRLIEPKKDSLQGHWEFKGRTLASDAANPARLQIPYIPPDEYNFKIVFTRDSGTDSIAQIMPKNKTQFAWVMAGHGNDSYGGFENVGGKGINGNSTFAKVPISTGQQYTSIVEVRNSGVKAFLNGELIREYKTDFKDMTPGMYKTKDNSVLGLGSWGSVYIFQTIELTEIGEHGRSTRGP